MNSQVEFEAGYYISTGSYVFAFCARQTFYKTTLDQDRSMNRRRFGVFASLSFALILRQSGHPCASLVTILNRLV